MPNPDAYEFARQLTKHWSADSSNPDCLRFWDLNAPCTCDYDARLERNAGILDAYVEKVTRNLTRFMSEQHVEDRAELERLRAKP